MRELQSFIANLNLPGAACPAVLWAPGPALLFAGDSHYGLLTKNDRPVAQNKPPNWKGKKRICGYLFFTGTLHPWAGASLVPVPRCHQPGGPAPVPGCRDAGAGHSLGTGIKAWPELFLLGRLRRLFRRQTLVHTQVSGQPQASWAAGWFVPSTRSQPVAGGGAWCHRGAEWLRAPCITVHGRVRVTRAVPAAPRPCQDPVERGTPRFPAPAVTC